MATAIKVSSSCGAAGRVARAATALPARPSLLLARGVKPLLPSLAPRPAPLLRQQPQPQRAPIARAAEAEGQLDPLERCVIGH
jgi:hypothetical protein